MVASDVATALADDPGIDLEAHVRGQFGSVLQPLMVVLRDGRVATNHEAIPGELLEAIRQERLETRPFGRGRGARTPRGLGETVPIQIDGRPVGRVIVWRGSPPLSGILRQLGPTLGVMAGSILVIGSGLIALFVFGPTRRRLKDVQDATTRLGAGDLSARAPEQGGDEVAALGRSFNRMADELASRAAALDASNRVRRQLLADVSHELMTPLTAMRGYVETLAMSEAQFDAPTRARYLGIALEETHRLERIIGDLLDLARLEGGGGTFRREPVDIAAVFDRVAARHGRDLEARAVRLTRHVDPAARTVPADPDRLEALALRVCTTRGLPLARAARMCVRKRSRCHCMSATLRPLRR
jgi:signal transduction histidine kinase